MSWLTPLGLLGLSGLIALIIIYIIKPIYQNKIISSTYIWKLSLRYRKKKIPVSKLRNILIFICQVLIITSIAFILGQPFIADDDAKTGADTVIIVDASVSMTAKTGNSTRLERAFDLVSQKVAKVYQDSEDNRVSIIVATDKPYFLVQDISYDKVDSITSAINDLRHETNGRAFTYATPDIKGAVKLAEQITAFSTDSSVTLYTDIKYIDRGEIEVISVSDTADWNAAVLDVRVINVENYYTFEIDVACFGVDKDIDVRCKFNGVNYEQTNPEYVIPVRCTSDEVQTIRFSVDPKVATSDKTVASIYQYNYVQVSINENDSLSNDNSFYLYGGRRPVLRVQYNSTLPNNFYASALFVLRDQLGSYWDVEIDEIKKDESYKTEGYDIYIFEHMVPSEIPTDGIVILSDPPSLPSSMGIQLGNTYQTQKGTVAPLAMGESHPINKNINAEEIVVTKFTHISNYDDYTPLFYCDEKPVALVKDTEDQKLVVLSFSMNYSNLALLPDFPLFMYNLVNYFTPKTFEGFVFDINDKVSFNARADVLNVTGPTTSLQCDSFPHDLTLDTPGVYTVTQDLISGETVIESFYVRIPGEESNINLTQDTLEKPYFYAETDEGDLDLLLYLAIALVSLLFIEWWLKSREQG